MKKTIFSRIVAILTIVMVLAGCGVNNAEALPEQSSAEEALAFTRQLSIGWNLGNTFDAYDGYEQKGAALDLETAWCGAITTKDVIDAVRDAGYTSIRIPVSWHNHVSGDEFTINSSWMTRVKTVVDYAIEDGLYVIINCHHDVDKAYYYPSTEYMDQSSRYVECIWKQISEEFRDYDEHLIFESINEPRMVGAGNEWWMPADTEKSAEAVGVINELNQLFVDTVRASGGNNINRYLLIPGYGSSVDGVLDDGFALPDDTASHKLIVTVHAYTPYDFALNIKGRGYLIEGDLDEVDSLMTRLNEKFVSQGIPVVMGEFGALDKDNIEQRVEYTQYYVQSAKDNGIPCIWWDNNAFNTDGENFGLLKRNQLEWVFPEIRDAMISVYED